MLLLTYPTIRPQLHLPQARFLLLPSVLVCRTIAAHPPVPTRQYYDQKSFRARRLTFSRSTGAVAELFDISCFVNTPFFTKIPDLAIAAWSKAPASISATQLVSSLSQIQNPALLGEHYFITNPVTGTGVSPKWDFTAHAFKGNAQAFVVAAKVANLAAPTGSKDVDWLFLNAVPGQGLLASQVYRTDTRLGQPPASVRLILSSPHLDLTNIPFQCTAGSNDISVKYVSKYCKSSSSLVSFGRRFNSPSHRASRWKRQEVKC